MCRPSTFFPFRGSVSHSRGREIDALRPLPESCSDNFIRQFEALLAIAEEKWRGRREERGRRKGRRKEEGEKEGDRGSEGLFWAEADLVGYLWPPLVESSCKLIG